MQAGGVVLGQPGCQRQKGFSRVVKNGQKRWAYLIRPAHFPYRAPLPCPQPFCHPFAEFLTSSGRFRRIACWSGDMAGWRPHFGHPGRVLMCCGSQ